MSSILRALKKLEDQTQEGQRPQPRSGSTDIKEAVNKHIKRKRFFRRFLSICLAVSVTSIAVWLIFNQSPMLLKRFFPDSRPLESVTEEATVSSIPPEEPNQGESVLPVEEIKTRPARSLSFPQKGIDELNLLPRKDPPNQDRERSLGNDSEPTLPRKPMVSGQADETKLELQAIAWSSVPEERIAIINGKIVREGEPIDGFSVSRIESEVVFVKEGDSEKKIVFKLK